jgi:hypothetical protein
MVGFDRRASDTQSRMIVLAVLAAGFLFRFLPLVLSPAIAHPDEVFQSLEQGHRLVYGYGLVPWEFDYAARSWLLGYLAAGAMRVSGLFGGGPQIYLPLIAGLLSAVGALTTLCAFLWGRRTLGTAAGIAAALISASWVDNMYFGGRSMAEAVAGNLLVVAIYLAEPGYRVEHRGRLFAAGLFSGAVLALRIHLAPAVALLWVWRGFDRRRWLYLTLGVLVVIACDGAFDAMTWHYPFEPLWRNIKFNLLQHGSDYYGTDPWWAYFYDMGANWGGTIAIFLPLALLAARRVPLIVVSAFVIVFVHSFIAHKEYRFVYPAVLLLSIAAGIGATDAVRLVSHGWRDRMRTPANPAIVVICTACWAILAFVNLIGRDYDKHWDRAHDSVEASLYVSKMHDVCGIALNRVGNYESGGYTYLHQRVPLYWGGDKSWTLMQKTQAFNVMIYMPKGASARATLPPRSGYRIVARFGDVDVLRRPGGCQPLPLPKPRIGKMGVGAVDDYPYVAGID